MKYDLTNEQFERLMKASQPVAMIALQCGTPPSPQENANAAWQDVAKEHGCRFDTIASCLGNPRSFTAEPMQEADRG